MLTYSASHSSLPKGRTSNYPYLLFLLVFAWLWPGVFSHDLWRPTEPQIFAAIQESEQTASWLPTLFGLPYFEVSPLYLNIAKGFKNALSPWAMDAFSASRFATVLFMSIAYLGCGVAGHKFWGNESGRSVIFILLGSIGLWGMGHFLDDQAVLFAGIGLSLWALAAIERQVVFSSLLLATGMILISQAAGWLLALFPLLLLFVLYMVSPLWKKRRYLIVWVGTQIMIWPIAAAFFLLMSQTSPDFFHQYWDNHLFGDFGGFKQFHLQFNLPYYWLHLLWFAFPAYPLAIWTASRLSLVQHKTGILALVWLLLALLMLSVYPQQHQDHLVWVLPILALLGAGQLDSLRRGAAAFLNWFGMMTFGAAALFLWLGFFAMNYGFPAKLAERAMYFSPYYQPEIKILPILIALSFTPIWIYIITRRHIRGRQAVSNWAAGMTLIWALLMTLFLPWLDAAKSYRPVVESMHVALPEQDRWALQNGACISIADSSLNSRLAWQQYSSFDIQTHQHCRYRLYEVAQHAAIAENERLIWQGKRPRNKHQHFILTERL